MNKKILIVEDNPVLVEILQKTVEFLGYGSVVATDGKEAVDMAAAQLPDLITLDISLPEMDGFEAARLIRQNPKTHLIPILAVTARSSPNDREECLQSGCNDYIAKPFTRSQLSSRIKNLLK